MTSPRCRSGACTTPSRTESVSGTFVATDPRSEDLTRLVGDVDLSLLNPTDPTSAKAPTSSTANSNAATARMADLLEVFKMDERFLAVLLSLSQEQIIKTNGPGTMYADESVIAQNNLAEYEELVANPRAAAMLDRLVVVTVPFVLSVRSEIRIYEKMLSGADLGRNDVSPLALPHNGNLRRAHSPHPPGRRDAGLDPQAAPLRRPIRHPWGHRGRRAPPRSHLRGHDRTQPRYVINRLSSVAGSTKGASTASRCCGPCGTGLPQRAGFTEAGASAQGATIAATETEYDEMVSWAA